MHTNMSIETLLVNIILLLLERSVSVINVDHQVYLLTCFLRKRLSPIYWLNLLFCFLYYLTDTEAYWIMVIGFGLP